MHCSHVILGVPKSCTTTQSQGQENRYQVRFIKGQAASALGIDEHIAFCQLEADLWEGGRGRLTGLLLSPLLLPGVARAVHHVSGALLPLITTAALSGPILISPTVSTSCSFVPSPCLHSSLELHEISLPI